MNIVNGSDTLTSASVRLIRESNWLCRHGLLIAFQETGTGRRGFSLLTLGRDREWLALYAEAARATDELQFTADREEMYLKHDPFIATYLRKTAGLLQIEYEEFVRGFAKRESLYRFVSYYHKTPDRYADTSRVWRPLWQLLLEDFADSGSFSVEGVTAVDAEQLRCCLHYHAVEGSLILDT